MIKKFDDFINENKKPERLYTKDININYSSDDNIYGDFTYKGIKYTFKIFDLDEGIQSKERLEIYLDKSLLYKIEYKNEGYVTHRDIVSNVVEDSSFQKLLKLDETTITASDEEIIDFYKKLKDLSKKNWNHPEIDLSPEEDTIRKFSHSGSDTTYIRKLLKTVKESSEINENMRDINFAINSIREFNRGTWNGDLNDLCKWICKHLGFKANERNVELCEEHMMLSRIDISEDEYRLSIDPKVISELYDILK